MKILIIEDSIISRNIYRKILSDKFEIQFELNGLDGFFAVQMAHKMNEAYDLVITDISMPYIDGAACINMIRLWEEENKISRWQGIPILISTSLDRYDYLINNARQGCDSIIFKPFNSNNLLEKIRLLTNDLMEERPVYHDLIQLKNAVKI